MQSAKLPSVVQVREWEECLTVLGAWDDADADAMDVQVCPDFTAAAASAMQVMRM